MGQRTIKFSDFSSEEIDNGNSARIMLTYNEPGNTVAVMADAAVDDEVVKLIEQHGKVQVRRGRKQAEARREAEAVTAE
jgi:hypothetical protein